MPSVDFGGSATVTDDILDEEDPVLNNLGTVGGLPLAGLVDDGLLVVDVAGLVVTGFENGVEVGCVETICEGVARVTD